MVYMQRPGNLTLDTGMRAIIREGSISKMKVEYGNAEDRRIQAMNSVGRYKKRWSR